MRYNILKILFLFNRASKNNIFFQITFVLAFVLVINFLTASKSCYEFQIEWCQSMENGQKVVIRNQTEH